MLATADLLHLAERAEALTKRLHALSMQAEESLRRGDLDAWEASMTAQESIRDEFSTLAAELLRAGPPLGDGGAGGGPRFHEILSDITRNLGLAQSAQIAMQITLAQERERVGERIALLRARAGAAVSYGALSAPASSGFARSG